ncbi:glycoside hydrolase family 15 [Occallatibacter savannae]|uniref:glycoside hydrolase family 15 n=1 Tax=Occallatibacter savannae TaxID=1002691 RepID=UPI0013A554B2|nr:glycoside hydrolase family 15 [Occallatibacter savannae]
MASHLVTGNGYGFAVVSPEVGAVTKFYAHPYSFVAPDPQKPLSEGIETTNFITSIGWTNPAGPQNGSYYVEDSHVIAIHSYRGDLMAFMPFGFGHPALILLSVPANSDERLQVRWAHDVDSEKEIEFAGAMGSSSGRVLHFSGVQESLLLVPLESVRHETKKQPLSGSRYWALISIGPGEDTQGVFSEFNQWRNGLTPNSMAKRETQQLERWRVKPAVHFASEEEQHLWRQSEVMLRMAQSREPNREGRHGNGLIVAALPDGVFFTPWVRDMAWATVALARMGHREEARAAVLAYFNAKPTGRMRAETGGADYQISVVRYFGNGEEEPFFTQEGSTNIEFDDWGEALWVLGEYLKRYDDSDLLQAETYRGNLYESARDFVMKPLLANTEPYGGGLIVAADTSIWEERQRDKKHFAFSTAAAIFGLREFADVAMRAGDEKTRSEVLGKADALQKGFDAAFIRGGHLRGTLEQGVKNDIDGALIPIINFGVVKDPTIIRDTVERMKLLKVVSGGYRRVRGTYTDPAIYEYWYEQEEFLFVDLSLAELYRRLGKTGEADAILARIVKKAAADHDIIPEMYVAVPCKLFPGKVGDPTGALPMVGYGAGAFVLHVMERERWRAAGGK